MNSENRVKDFLVRVITFPAVLLYIIISVLLTVFYLLLSVIATMFAVFFYGTLKIRKWIF